MLKPNFLYINQKKYTKLIKQSSTFAIPTIIVHLIINLNKKF